MSTRDRRALEAEGVGDAAGDARSEVIPGRPRRSPGTSTPAKTPVALPRSDAGSIPASSRASQDASSRGAAGGPSPIASRGLMPKKPGSKSAASSRKPPSSHVAGARRARLGVVEPLQVPAAVGGEAGDRVAARGDQVPELRRRADAAGQAAGHADDRDRLLAAGPWRP